MRALLQFGHEAFCVDRYTSCRRRRIEYLLNSVGQGPQLPQHRHLEKLFHISSSLHNSIEQLPIVVVNVNGTACDERRANDGKSEIIILRHRASIVLKEPPICLTSEMFPAASGGPPESAVVHDENVV
jgi:hypothetical protein